MPHSTEGDQSKNELCPRKDPHQAPVSLGLRKQQRDLYKLKDEADQYGQVKIYFPGVLHFLSARQLGFSNCGVAEHTHAIAYPNQ